MSLFKEILKLLYKRKKLFLLPVVLILLIFAFLFIFIQGSPIAPFIYTIF